MKHFAIVLCGEKQKVNDFITKILVMVYKLTLSKTCWVSNERCHVRVSSETDVMDIVMEEIMTNECPLEKWNIQVAYCTCA